MSKRSGAWLVRYALEQLPVSFTFGIPGVHNTEIYDELGKSEKIQPILVTHESCAGFMADAVSRISGDQIGTLMIVPAAGATHAMSGIGEAFLDGIPLMVISGGIRTDATVKYQLHEIDQQKLVQSVTKGFWRVQEHRQIVPTIFEAYCLAVSGEPGPVFIEVPVNIQLYQGSVESLLTLNEFMAKAQAARVAPADSLSQAIEAAADLLAQAKAPGIFAGWGAMGVTPTLERLAELLGAPVATTLQGLSVFRGDHPLHTGMGFSNAAVPAAENAFKDCDCLLAIGTRFGEIPTGSFGARVPSDLIHLDINSDVFNCNYEARVTLEGDAKIILPRLLEKLERRSLTGAGDRRARIENQIAQDKKSYLNEWRSHTSKNRVNPFLFFETLRSKLANDAIVAVDDGNHTFLAAELFEVRQPRTFISPTDFNCMGYCVPAAIGAKLVHPKKQVIGIVGDGALLMTGLEILTAATLNLGVVYFIFHDGELSQISQGQEIPYNRKTCTLLGTIRVEGIALATGAAYFSLTHNEDLNFVIEQSLQTAAKGQPVLVDVAIDYSKRTRFTAGVVQTVLKRFPIGDKFRFIGRAVWRKAFG